MIRTIEISDTDEIVIKLPKEYQNKNLEIFVMPLSKNSAGDTDSERDLFDDYYRGAGYK